MKKKIILFLSYEAVLYIVFSFKMYFLISFIMSKVKISYDIRINMYTNTTFYYVFHIINDLILLILPLNDLFPLYCLNFVYYYY